jgi:hypothetical protein
MISKQISDLRGTDHRPDLDRLFPSNSGGAMPGQSQILAAAQLPEIAAAGSSPTPFGGKILDRLAS